MTKQGDSPAEQGVRVTVRFQGRVQGVGFRYTAMDIAGDFDVSGFVRNEDDGSVLLVAEGKENVLQAFLQRIRSSFVGRYITRETVDWAHGTGDFPSFTVRH